MKTNAAAVILLLACVGLVIGLVVTGKHHEEEKQNMDRTIVSYSNHVTTLEGQLREQITINTTLDGSLKESRAEAARESNALVAVHADLSATQEALEKTRADARAAADKAVADLDERDKKIKDLENQNQDLDKTSNELRASISDKQAEIEATQKKLAASEGDNAALLKELKQLRAQKEELEKKLNDLAMLKEQIRKLRDDLTLARKLDWIKRGIYDSITVKGAERLMHPQPAAAPLTNAPMQVELRQSGGVSVSTPGSADTNSPPVK